jgi:uncharacterized protein
MLYRNIISAIQQPLSSNKEHFMVIESTEIKPVRSRRGFAAMDRQRQREIASLGGKSAHASGHAHEFTPDEARAAGKKRHQRALDSVSPTA